MMQSLILFINMAYLSMQTFAGRVNSKFYGKIQAVAPEFAVCIAI